MVFNPIRNHIEPEKNIYYNKGVKRKSDIYGWFFERLLKSNLRNEMTIVYYNAKKGDISKAYKLFVNLLDKVIKENYHYFGYIIDRNRECFGEENINMDFYNGCVAKQTKTELDSKKLKGTIRELKEIKGDLDRDKLHSYFFGYNTNNDREQAVLIFRKTESGKFFPVLQSVATGKILRQSEEFKKEYKRRQNA